jgi:hypothetical protein
LLPLSTLCVYKGNFERYNSPRNIGQAFYFYLVVDDYNTSVINNFFGAFNSSVLNKNILARISTQLNTMYNQIDQNNMRAITPAREYMGPVNLNNFTIQLLDEYGRVVNLNNMDFSFSIQITSVYNL